MRNEPCKLSWLAYWDWDDYLAALRIASANHGHGHPLQRPLIQTCRHSVEEGSTLPTIQVYLDRDLDEREWSTLKPFTYMKLNPQWNNVVWWNVINRK